MGCYFLLQGSFPTQGSNPGLLHCRQTLYPLSHHGSPKVWWWGRNCLCARMLRQGVKSPTGTHYSNRGQTMEKAKAQKGWSTSLLSVRRGAGARLLKPLGELMKNGFKEGNTSQRGGREKLPHSAASWVLRSFCLERREGAEHIFGWKTKCVLKFPRKLQIYESHHFIQKTEIHTGLSLNGGHYRCSRN